MSVGIRSLSSFGVPTDLAVTSPEGDTIPTVAGTHSLLNRAIKLMTDPHTKHLGERHRLLLLKIIKSSYQGYKLRELKDLANLFKLCAEFNVENPDIYNTLLLELIYLCQHPFLKERSSDEQRFYEESTNFISQLGYLLRDTEEKIQGAICSVLEELYDHAEIKSHKVLDDSVRRVSLEFLRSAIENSDVIEYIFKLHVTRLDFGQLRFTTLRLMRKMAQNSIHCSCRLITLGSPKFICMSMCAPANFNELISNSVETMWNTIDHPHEDMQIVTQWVKQMGESQCLLQLRDAFFNLLTQGHSQICRSLRNDILTLLILVTKLAVNVSTELPLVELGIVKQLAQLAIYEQIKCVNPLFKNLRLLPNTENFDLKKLLFVFLTNLTNDSSAIKTLSEMQLIDALLGWAYPVSGKWSSSATSQFDLLSSAAEKTSATEKVVKTPRAVPPNDVLPALSANTNEDNADYPVNLPEADKRSGLTESQTINLNAIAQWPVTFMEELQLHALDTLSILGPVLLDDFLHCNGPCRVTALLKWCHLLDPFVCQGNSFHGSGGRFTRRAQMRYTLRLIRSLIVVEDKRIIESFAEQGIRSLLVSSLSARSIWINNPVLGNLYNPVATGDAYKASGPHESVSSNSVEVKDIQEADDVGIEIMSDILFILARICDTNVQQKEGFGTEGITALLSILSTLPYRLQKLYYHKTRPSFPISHGSTISNEINNSILLPNHPVFKLATILVDAIWSCVVGYKEAETFFVSNQGLILMLNLLEWYPRELCSQLLGCLVDLTEDPQHVPQLLSWSGCCPLSNELELPEALENSHGQSQSAMTGDKQVVTDMTHAALNPTTTGPTLPQLLCKLWRWEEGESQSVLSGAQAELHDSTENQGANFRENHDPICTTPMTSSINCTRFERIRFNIYALVRRMEFPEYDNLSTQDRLTMCKIVRYFELKNAELWSEMMKELEMEGLRPITPDAEVLQYIRRWGQVQRETISNGQLQLLQLDEEKALEEEQALYNRIREMQRTREQEQAFLTDYLKRTSDINYLKEAKLKQRNAIDASRMGHRRRTWGMSSARKTTGAISDSTDTYTDDADVTKNSVDEFMTNFANGVIWHNTDVKNTNVTAFISQSVSIESTPAEIFHKPSKLEAELLAAIAQKKAT